LENCEYQCSQNTPTRPSRLYHLTRALCIVSLRSVLKAIMVPPIVRFKHLNKGEFFVRDLTALESREVRLCCRMMTNYQPVCESLSFVHCSAYQILFVVATHHRNYGGLRPTPIQPLFSFKTVTKPTPLKLFISKHPQESTSQCPSPKSNTSSTKHPLG